MKLEQQVCSLELAKRLKELGVKKESIVSWQLFRGWGEHSDKWELRHYSDFRSDGSNEDEVCAAFSVAELGEMLPININTRRHPTAKDFFICVLDESDQTWEGADTEADARAQMVVYLLENKLITL